MPTILTEQCHLRDAPSSSNSYLDFALPEISYHRRRHLYKDIFPELIECNVRCRADNSAVIKRIPLLGVNSIREACGNDNDDDTNGFLRGIVEADETYIGGKETNKHESKKIKAGRGTVGKIAVIGMRERGGIVKASVINGTASSEIRSAVRNTVLAGSTLCTDEHASYRGMPEYAHHIVNHSAKQFVDGMAAHTNGIESFWAVLKRGFYGTYHQFSRKHLQRYVDEFAYRLNDGNVRVKTMDRVDALLDKTIGIRLTYANLTA